MNTAPKPLPTREQMMASAYLVAILGGCTCSPDISVREVTPGVYVAEVGHDSWCAHPSQSKGKDA